LESQTKVNKNQSYQTTTAKKSCKGRSRTQYHSHSKLGCFLSTSATLPL